MTHLIVPTSVQWFWGLWFAVKLQLHFRKHRRLYDRRIQRFKDQRMRDR